MKTSRQLVDTNVLVRFFTGKPPDQAQKTYSLIAAADRGETTLVVLPLVVAETVYTLQSFYKMKTHDIATQLMVFLQSRGIHVVEKVRILETLKRYRDHNVSFIDAYLATSSIEENIPIASFDRDFDQFEGVLRIEPKGN